MKVSSVLQIRSHPISTFRTTLEVAFRNTQSPSETPGIYSAVQIFLDLSCVLSPYRGILCFVAQHPMFIVLVPAATFQQEEPHTLPLPMLTPEWDSTPALGMVHNAQTPVNQETTFGCWWPLPMQSQQVSMLWLGMMGPRNPNVSWI